MNRREAIAALVSLPALKNVSVANLAPNDVVVVECEGLLSRQSKAQIKDQLGMIWPDRKIVVLDGGLRLRVMREGQ